MLVWDFYSRMVSYVIINLIKMIDVIGKVEGDIVSK